MPSNFPPKVITDLRANWHTSRHGLTPVVIVGHGTVGRDSRDYLRRGGDLPDGSDRKVSIHALFMKNGDVYEMVPDERVANHAGFARLELNGKVYHSDGVNVNAVSLGYELENLQNGKDPYPEAQLLSMGWWIVTKRAKFGHLPIVRHTEIDPPPRRYDTVGLSVAQIESWVAKAAALMPTALSATEQRWALWGMEQPLDVAARGFGIPSRWFQVAEKLGAARGEAFYPDARNVFQSFERGFIHGPAAGGPVNLYRVVYF
jgi:hypothetical protein